jgi:hypothetical protein
VIVHSFKLHFCMFERPQVKHNNLNCHNELLECCQLIVKFTCSKLDTNQFFLHVQNIQTSRVDNIYFFKHFFKTKFVPFLLKIKHDFNIND